MAGTELRDALAAAGARIVERDGGEAAADFGDVLAEHRAVREAVGVAVRPRAVIGVSGPQAEQLLQGLLSNDVARLAVGSARYALVLTPKARVVVDLRVLRIADDAFALDLEPAAGPLALRTLTRYRLGAKAEIAPLAWGVVAVGGPAAGIALLDAFGILPRVDAPEGDGFDVPLGEARAFGVPSGFCGDKGFEMLAPAPLAAEAFAALVAVARRRDGGPVGADALELLRVEAGVPRFGAEIGEEVMPAEAGLVERAVSFTKGCYVGQEPVARLHYRGHANRGLRSILLADAVPPAGAEIALDGRAVGRVTSAVDSPTLGRALALAIVRREVDEGSRVQVAWDGGSAEGEVAAVPAYRYRG